jgi:hypothetical protein
MTANEPFDQKFSTLRKKAEMIEFHTLTYVSILSVLKRIAASLPKDIRFEMVLYYPSRGLFRLRRLIDPRMWGARTAEFTFEPISGDAVSALVARTRIAVDIERAVQSGYTMRTIEMVGAQKKLITTNGAIRRADFFHEDNIAVIDRNEPRVDDEFLRKAYAPIDPAILSRYSLKGWLDELLPGL